MAAIEFTILDETEYIDRTDPAKPVEKILVTFQTPDGRVDSISLAKEGYTKESRNRAIADHIKKRPARSAERVVVR